MKIVVDRLLAIYMDRYQEPDGSYWPTINLIYLAHPVDADGHLTHVDAGEISELTWQQLDAPPTDVAFPTQQLGALDVFLATR